MIPPGTEATGTGLVAGTGTGIVTRGTGDHLNQ